MDIISKLDLEKIKESHQAEIEAIESLIKRDESLIKENERLRDEAYKDETIKELKAKNEELLKENRRGFPISEDEWNKLNNWKDTHIRKKHFDKKTKRPKSFGAIGGNFTYEFTPTGIGTIGVIKCSCGECFTFQDI